MKNILTLSIFILISWSAFSQEQDYWQQKVDCNIEVSLNDSSNTLNGNISIQYFNNSPDTLSFIWFHLWANAYKNDRTAFSEQLLENGRTDFYFSDDAQKGYINQLDFKVDQIKSRMEIHPKFEDIVKIILPKPLLPGTSITIETPFHEKLPFQFSRTGYQNHSYQITQWFPKPAVYDKKGWHEMPYLDQGEFYSEFGNYHVAITVPKGYKVAATGKLLTTKDSIDKTTLVYEEKNIHDYAWFTDKDFIIEHDTLQLQSKIIDVYHYHYKREDKNNGLPINTIDYIKRAIKTKSQWIGEYPFEMVSVVESKADYIGGMEYTTIALIENNFEWYSHDLLINHEVGHNWFYGILASNERDYPWMDEGMNTYYDNRYSSLFYPETDYQTKFIKKRMPDDMVRLMLDQLYKEKKDQPITTKAAEFSELNYNVIAYSKTADWMKSLERKMKKDPFDKMMKKYFDKWKFKHPYPEDFKKVVESSDSANYKSFFSLLDAKGSLIKTEKKKIKFYPYFNFNNTTEYNYIFFSPIIGYNYYDKFMIGGLLHNYTLPSSRFQFVTSAFYSNTSKRLNGIGKLSYTKTIGENGGKIALSIDAATFTKSSFTDADNQIKYMPFSKIAPGITLHFGNEKPRSTINKSISLKSYFINETELLFKRDFAQQIDFITYPIEKRVLNQLRFLVENKRVLYPYKSSLLAEQGKGFIKVGLTSNCFFNYIKEGGLELRAFAGKFFYTTEKTFLTQYETDRYHLNMSGANGYEDYTYNNYFIGRNEFEGFPTRQMMMKDGAFKVHTDFLSDKIGKSDDWLASVNLATTIPKKINPLDILPVNLHLKLFLDVGTYAASWQKNPPTEKILYDAGFQLSLFKDILTIYFPVVYSKSYQEYFKSVLNEKIFLKNISFSIDLEKLTLKNIFPQLSF